MTTSMALTRDDVIIGVDTHKDRHEAVSLDGLGARLGDQSISVSLDGYSQLVDWATTQGSIWGFGAPEASRGTKSIRSLSLPVRVTRHRSKPPWGSWSLINAIAHH